MMGDMGRDDEFAEFDTTEDQIDAMMAHGQPVEVDVPGPGIEALFTRATGPSPTWGVPALIPALVPAVPPAGSSSETQITTGTALAGHAA